MQLTYSLTLKRTAIVLRKSSDGRKAICIDEDNASEILLYIEKDERHRKKFRFICDLILAGLRNTELYDKEDIALKSKRVTAMKFFKGQENDRIYCIEQRIDNKLYTIICVELVQRKKTKGISKKIKAIIENIAKYEYEIKRS